MKALIQRVSSASVEVDGKVVGAIDKGLLVFLGVEKDDSREVVERMVHKLVNYRVFADGDDKMNLSVSDINGQLLIVSQFTLAASTTKGMRPSFSSAASPELAEALYEHCIEIASREIDVVQSGQFAANMQVALVNDGPVTFLLEIS